MVIVNVKQRRIGKAYAYENGSADVVVVLYKKSLIKTLNRAGRRQKPLPCVFMVVEEGFEPPTLCL